MKTTYIFPQISDSKNLAIWYYGQGVVAEVVHSNRKILIKSPEVVHIVDNSGKRLQKSKAIKALDVLKISNDTELYAHNDKVSYDYFGLFDFVYVNMLNGAEEVLSNDETYSYSDAIKYAEETILTDEFWIDTDKPINKVTTINANENWIKYAVKGEEFVPPTKELLK